MSRIEPCIAWEGEYFIGLTRARPYLIGRDSAAERGKHRFGSGPDDPEVAFAAWGQGGGDTWAHHFSFDAPAWLSALDEVDPPPRTDRRSNEDLIENAHDIHAEAVTRACSWLGRRLGGEAQAFTFAHRFDPDGMRSLHDHVIVRSDDENLNDLALAATAEYERAVRGIARLAYGVRFDGEVPRGMETDPRDRDRLGGPEYERRSYSVFGADPGRRQTDQVLASSRPHAVGRRQARFAIDRTEVLAPRDTPPAPALWQQPDVLREMRDARSRRATPRFRPPVFGRDRREHNDVERAIEGWIDRALETSSARTTGRVRALPLSTSGATPARTSPQAPVYPEKNLAWRIAHEIVGGSPSPKATDARRVVKEKVDWVLERRDRAPDGGPAVPARRDSYLKGIITQMANLRRELGRPLDDPSVRSAFGREVLTRQAQLTYAPNRSGGARHPRPDEPSLFDPRA